MAKKSKKKKAEKKKPARKRVSKPAKKTGLMDKMRGLFGL